jgi:toxin ParE1/3/4
MINRVILRPAAVDDIEGIFLYIGRQSPQVANRFLDACMTEIQRLCDMPGLGRLREFSSPKAVGVRASTITGFPNHLIFYRQVDVGIEVLHVIHGARDIESIFEEPAP